MLTFGLNQVLPRGVRAAWGARLIVDQNGHVDVVWNRTDCAGDDEARQELLTWLNDDVKRQPWENLRTKLLSGLSVGSNEVVELYRDNRGVMFGSPNNSYGYVYVAAWLAAHDRGEAT